MTNIVFDFGAVLFNWQPHQLVQQHFPDHAPTEAQARGLASAIFHHADWQAFDCGRLAQDTVIARTADRLALPQTTVHALVSGIATHLQPIEPTVRLLRQLHARRDSHADLRLYFLSNMPAPFARALEQRHDFLGLFDGGVFSGDVLLAKPQPEIYQLVETRYGLEPSSTIFVDDLLANVLVARARGWRAVHFESAAQLAPHLAAWLP